MSGAKKPRILTPESDDSDGSFSSYPEEVQTTFEGRNPEAQDFHGIQQLLHQLFLNAHIDLSQMSDMLIAQAGIGSVLKQSCNDSDDEEDDDMVNDSDVYGVTSVINLTLHRETPCVKQFLTLIQEQLKNKSDVQKCQEMKDILSSKRIGLLINERFVNIPSQIGYPMLNTLHDEILRMKKKNCEYNFDYYIMICKTWSSKTQISGPIDITFSNDEEQVFRDKSEYTFSYSVAGKTDTGLTGRWQTEDKALFPYRTVLFFRAASFPDILNKINTLILKF